MKFRGGEFPTGTKGNFQPELTISLFRAFWRAIWARLPVSGAQDSLKDI